jgi:hypothetical protein
MARKPKYQEPDIAKKFVRESSLLLDGFQINHGETIKIRGEFGAKFKFQYLVTNTDTGAQWIDCFEIIGGVASVFRSFKLDRIKRVPKRGKRAKRVV